MPKCSCTTHVALPRGGFSKLPCGQEATNNGMCFYHDKVREGLIVPESIAYHQVLRIESEEGVLWEK